MLNNLNPTIALVDLVRDPLEPIRPTSCLY